MIVFLLRHADRSNDQVDDLNAAGRKRAELLARMLAESGVTVAFRSQFVRAVRTLKPLDAKLAGALQVRPIDTQPNETSVAYGIKVAEAVLALAANTTAVVVGHSDTLGPTIKRLGGGAIETIQATEFDKLFVVFIAPDGSATLLKLRYGAPT
jgi:phosphohistidine phosphatase SixA